MNGATQCSSINHRKALKVLMKVSRTIRRYSKPFYYYSFAAVGRPSIYVYSRKLMRWFLVVYFFSNANTHCVYVWLECCVIIFKIRADHHLVTASSVCIHTHTLMIYSKPLYFKIHRFYSYATIILPLLIKA